MAKILIATNPIAGHTTPAYPVAKHLVERGHEIVWYTGKAFQRQVEATGARFVPVKSAIDWSTIDILQWVKQNYPKVANQEGITLIKAGMKLGFIEPARGHLQDCLEILADFKAEVILSDSLFVTGEFLYQKTGIPFAQFGESVLGINSKDTAPFGPALAPSASFFGRLRNRFLTWLTGKIIFKEVNQFYEQTRADLGLPKANQPFFESIITPFLYMQGTVPSFEYPRSDLPAHVHFVGPFLPSRTGEFVPPSWWEQLQENRPVVLVTQGTVNNDINDLIVPALKAFEDENALVIVTTGNSNTGNLKPAQIPPNAKVEAFIPYWQILPYVDVMVTNGGYGGVQMALAHGVPLIVAGTTEDKAEVNARVGWSKTGINLKTKASNARQIKEAYQKILSDSTYRRHATQIKLEMAQHDPPGEAAELLEELIATKQAVTNPVGLKTVSLNLTK
jgi:MGT family glycosyltransferase